MLLAIALDLAGQTTAATAVYAAATKAAAAHLQSTRASGALPHLVEKPHRATGLAEQTRPYARELLRSSSVPRLDNESSCPSAPVDAAQDDGGWGGVCAVASERARGGDSDFCSIERRDATELSVKEFEERYVAAGRPVIITDYDGIRAWPAKRMWQRDQMIQKHSSTTVSVARSSEIVLLQITGDTESEHRLHSMSLSEYIRQHTGEAGERKGQAERDDPMYLFRSIPMEGLQEAFRHPAYFGNRSLFHLPDQVGVGYRRQLSVAPCGAPEESFFRGRCRVG